MVTINGAEGFITGIVMFNIFLFGIVCFVLYMIIKAAIRNGVKEAIEKQELQLEGIKDLLFALVRDKYTDNEDKK